MRDLSATIGNLLGKYSNSKRPMKDKDGIYKGGDHNAIKHLRNGKAARPDNVSAEALKVDIRTTWSCSTLFQYDLGKGAGTFRVEGRFAHQAPPKAPASITEV